jgi:hypothetical protein
MIGCISFLLFRDICGAQVKGVKDDMSAIRSNINQIKELHSKIVTEVSQTKSKGMSPLLPQDFFSSAPRPPILYSVFTLRANSCLPTFEKLMTLLTLYRAFG